MLAESVKKYVNDLFKLERNVLDWAVTQKGIRTKIRTKIKIIISWIINESFDKLKVEVGTCIKSKSNNSWILLCAQYALEVGPKV